MYQKILLLIFSTPSKYPNITNMTAKALILSILVLFFALKLSAQNFVGKNKEEVRKLMAEYQKELIEDESVNNPVYDMIRYSDRDENQTIIFVFENGLCRYYKQMCDYSLMKEITKRLDAENKRVNDSTWSFQTEGNDYIISLKKEQWYFVVSTRKKEQ